MAHNIQPRGPIVHGGIEREGTILIVGQKPHVVHEVTRNVGAVQGDEALGPDRRVEELDVK
jgi:hypothetical protein